MLIFYFILKLQLQYYFITFYSFPNECDGTAHIVRRYRINKANRFH